MNRELAKNLKKTFDASLKRAPDVRNGERKDWQQDLFVQDRRRHMVFHLSRHFARTASPLSLRGIELAIYRNQLAVSIATKEQRE